MRRCLLLLSIFGLCAATPKAPTLGKTCTDHPGTSPGRADNSLDPVDGYDFSQDCDAERFDQDCSSHPSSCAAIYLACDQPRKASCESCQATCLGGCKACDQACPDGGTCQHACLRKVASCRAKCAQTNSPQKCEHAEVKCEAKLRKSCTHCDEMQRCVAACPDFRDAGLSCQNKCGSDDCLTSCVQQ
jgi:hypothetical protein